MTKIFSYVIFASAVSFAACANPPAQIVTVRHPSVKPWSEIKICQFGSREIGEICLSVVTSPSEGSFGDPKSIEHLSLSLSGSDLGVELTEKDLVQIDDPSLNYVGLTTSWAIDGTPSKDDFIQVMIPYGFERVSKLSKFCSGSVSYEEKLDRFESAVVVFYLSGKTTLRHYEAECTWEVDE